MAIGDGVSAIASLTAGFGGFSPTALDGVEESKKQVQLAENALMRMREMRERREALVRARTSRPKTYVESSGTTWTYVVLDGSVARIVDCTTKVKTLRVPRDIEGIPVFAIGSEACAGLEGVEEIICEDSIEVIGSCAFRWSPDLRRVVLPESVSEFSVSWLQKCPSLEELVLPGLLDRITAAVFDNENLRRLHIGKNVSFVEPGAFEKSNLEVLDLDPENPYLASDGMAIYSKDETVLIALGRPVRHYDAVPGCEKIAKKAFCYMRSLESVTLPKSLETVGKFAFASSGLRSITLPPKVKVVGEKAFYGCGRLESVILNDGLLRIDASAFEASSLPALHIPSSVFEIGKNIVAHTAVVRSGPDATISIDPANESLFLDEIGALYRREDDGVHLIQLIDPHVVDFKAHEDTRFVDSHAFAFLAPNIERVSFSDGLKEVRESAFRVCPKLKRVDLPDSVCLIGQDAFLDTNIESFRVPAELESLGEDALVTAGAHRLGEPPSLAHVSVGQGNERFFVDSGMLFERTASGDRVIVCTGEVADVRIPDTATSIAPYAFSNNRKVRTLHLPASLKVIGSSGLGVWSYVELIHVELEKPVEGRCSFDFRFPDTNRAVHSICLALGGSSWVNVHDIMAQYDNCIANAHDYRGNDRDSIGIYEQVIRVIDRLSDPVLLTNVNRKNFNRLFNDHLEEICVDIARHDDREAMDALLEFGYLNENNLESIISAVGRLQDAAMTAYLLEVKRRQFGERAMDFDL